MLQAFEFYLIILCFVQGILIGTFLFYEPPSYGDYDFPPWANAVGWVLSFSSVSLIPIVAIFKICRETGTFSEVNVAILGVWNLSKLPREQLRVITNKQMRLWIFSFQQFGSPNLGLQCTNLNILSCSACKEIVSTPVKLVSSSRSLYQTQREFWCQASS